MIRGSRPLWERVEDSALLQSDVSPISWRQSIWSIWQVIVSSEKPSSRNLEDVDYWRHQAGWYDDDDEEDDYLSSSSSSSSSTSTAQDDAYGNKSTTMHLFPPFIFKAACVCLSIFIVFVAIRAIQHRTVAVVREHQHKIAVAKAAAAAAADPLGKKSSHHRGRSRSKPSSRRVGGGQQQQQQRRSRSRTRKGTVDGDYNIMEDSGDHRKASGRSRSRSVKRSNSRSRSKSRTQKNTGPLSPQMLV
jgi:hypothetical protein